MLRVAGLLLMCSSLCLCFYKANNTFCGPFQFQCDNLRCLPAIFVCDGINDCIDNSDEKDCTSNYEVPFNYFVQCAENEFTCKDKNGCIPIENFCNGHVDCEDKSDEFKGCTEKLDCTGKFRCMDRHCISNSWVCDKLKDCPDGSDELNCDDKMLAHDCNSSRRYRCTNKRCIHIETVCDGNNDCGDSSDEGLDCILNCTLKCDHECKITPRGSQCVCKPGYELQNNITCIDMDECEDPLTQYGICDQRCMNTVGSYSCFCDMDYTLQDDKKTCKAKGGEATLIYITNNEIHGLYLGSLMYFEVADDNMSQIQGVTVDRDYVYWIDVIKHDAVIVGMDTKGKREIIVPYGLKDMSAIAVDWITGNIYFASEWEESIGVCNSNGLLCTIIERETGPEGLVLLPNEGLMFWSAHVKNKNYGQILKADMDGKNKMQLVTSKWPKAMTIDYPNNRLYWIDSKENTIESILFNGKDRRIILSDTGPSFSLAIFENKLFWSSLFTIMSCDKFSGKNKQIKIQSSNHAHNIHIDHPSLKPNIHNPCHSNPCSQLCILGQHNGYTCACTLDKKLDVDNHTCQELEKLPQLIIIDDNKFIHYNHTILGRPTITLDYTQFRFISAATYDSLSGTVIASYGDKIFRYNPFNDIITPLALSLDANIHVGGIAFDHIGNNLYLSNTNEKTIEVHSLTTHAKTVFNLFEKPYDIALWPEKGIMYVTTKTDKYRILIMTMNGTVEQFSKKQYLPDYFKGPKVSLYFDRDLQKLFLSDQNSGRILSYSDNSFTDQSGYTRAHDLNIPVSLAVSGNFIFWTHYRSNKLVSKYLKEQRTIKFYLPTSVISSNLLIVALRATVTREGNGCQKNNGNCSHVCLPSSTTAFICACPPGMMLNTNKRTCTNLTACPTNEIKCSEHDICIKQNKWCNGIQDCPNGEDESSDCEKTGICKEDQFMCKNRMCISLKDLCNSHYDCADKSDEENCFHQKCKSDEFQCREGKCISNFLVCNGDDDCSDFSDELNCDTRTCLISQFRCESGKCISKSLVCDDEMDCPDKSDELHCDKKICNDSNGKFLCLNGHCISKLLVCNGINDCGDKSDEHNCLDMGLDFNHCAKNEYSCIYSNKCIPQKARCDGIKDCPKSDDEHHCAYCNDREFSCNNTKCIPQIWVCNGEDECGDNSDEKDCSGSHHGYISNPSIKCEEFKCSVDVCLPFSKVCNGIPDCPDGSDEEGKCNMACAMNNVCFGLCYKTPQGGVCSCQDGYRLAADKVSCEDINECDLDVCSQICENTIGSFKCSCYDGYVPHSDKVSCKVDGPPMEFIIATDKDIRKVSANLFSIEVIHTLYNPRIADLDMNVMDGNIYWSNEEWGMIKKINIRNETTEFMGRLNPTSLSVDWITNNVYFVNNGQPFTIMVADFKKQINALLIKIVDNAKVSSLLVDPKNRLLFWSQFVLGLDGLKGKIYRSDIMGADKKSIVKDLGLVSAIAIDNMKFKLYWSDIFHKCVESSNFDGNQRTTIFRSDRYTPLDIGIFENLLYSLMNSNGQIRKCKLYGDKSCETIHVGMGIHTHFAILYQSKHLYVDNPCEKKNCDYMCVLNANDTVCICEDGKPIEANSICKNTNNDIILRDTDTGPKHIKYPKIYTIIVIVILIIAVLLYGYFYYQKYKIRSGTKTNLGIRFQNPSYDRQDEVAVTIDPVASNISPGQHEYTNPIDDKLLTAAKESSAKMSKRRLEQGTSEIEVENIEREGTEEEDELLISFVQPK